MRVESPLADINFTIGSMKRQGNTLVFKSGKNSSLDSTVHMNAEDAGSLIKSFLTSPSAIGFALSLPFLWIFKSGNAQSKTSNETSDHPFDAMNKPW